MRIELKFFASIREALQCAEEVIEVDSSIQTVGQLRALLCSRGPLWQQALGEHKVLRTALQQQMCEADSLLLDGAEVAFFPPVTGG